jgi:hypothetical protein
MTKFCGETPCSECPWRKDIDPGQFSAANYERLRVTAEGDDWFKPIFACHKAPMGEEFACVGYLMSRAGWSNLNVRMAARAGAFDPGKLHSDAPLYETYEELMEVHGPTC